MLESAFGNDEVAYKLADAQVTFASVFIELSNFSFGERLARRVNFHFPNRKLVCTCSVGSSLY